MFKLSKLALLLCCFLIFVTGVFYFPKWNEQRTEATISWDVSGYYVYLPAVFIYRDLKQLGFKDSIISRYMPTPDWQQAMRHESGNYVFKYASGQAVLLSPFFFVGHAAASASAIYPADGFSFPYQIAIGIGALLYAFLGLWVLRKVLITYFSEAATAATLLAVVFGSNYLNYAAIDGAMTHNTLFTIYSLLLFFTIRFYKSPGMFSAVMIGVMTGLATLTRPTELISCLIPLLWGVAGLQEFRDRLRFLFRHSRYISAAAGVAAAIISIQLIYWKSMTGQWFVYSYGDEGFDWLHPHIINGMFSYRSGWLMYSPVMVLPLIGFVSLFKRYRDLFWACFIFSGLFMYLCFAWQTWWYGGSLGQRAMIQAYPVLAFPMAALFQQVFKKGWFMKSAMMVFLLFCSWYNLWWTHQAHRGGLYRPEEMNRQYFWKILGKSQVDERAEHLLDNEVLFDQLPANAELVYSHDFEEDTTGVVDGVEGLTGKSLYLDAERQFSEEYSFFPGGNKTALRATADFRATRKEWTFWRMTQFAIRFYRGDVMTGQNMIRVFRVLGDGETKTLMLDAKIPGGSDRATVVFWNSGGDKTIYIDNLKVFAF